MAFIFVGIMGIAEFYFPRNAIKLGRSCILGACLLCISLPFEGLISELTIVDGALSVLDLFIVMIFWYNKIIIFFRTSEAIHLEIGVNY